MCYFEKSLQNLIVNLVNGGGRLRRIFLTVRNNIGKDSHHTCVTHRDGAELRIESKIDRFRDREMSFNQEYVCKYEPRAHPYKGTVDPRYYSIPTNDRLIP
jgi:hypothetical protein